MRIVRVLSTIKWHDCYTIWRLTTMQALYKHMWLCMSVLLWSLMVSVRITFSTCTNQNTTSSMCIDAKYAWARLKFWGVVENVTDTSAIERYALLIYCRTNVTISRARGRTEQVEHGTWTRVKPRYCTSKRTPTTLQSIAQQRYWTKVQTK